jgi:hypothetical protein
MIIIVCLNTEYSQKMNNTLEGSGGKAIVKLRIAEAIQGMRNKLLPVVRVWDEFKEHRHRPADRNDGLAEIL